MVMENDGRAKYMELYYARKLVSRWLMVSCSLILGWTVSEVIYPWEAHAERSPMLARFNGLGSQDSNLWNQL